MKRKKAPLLPLPHPHPATAATDPRPPPPLPPHLLPSPCVCLIAALLYYYIENLLRLEEEWINFCRFMTAALDVLRENFATMNDVVQGCASGNSENTTMLQSCTDLISAMLD